MGGARPIVSAGGEGRANEQDRYVNEQLGEGSLFIIRDVTVTET